MFNPVKDTVGADSKRPLPFQVPFKRLAKSRVGFQSIQGIEEFGEKEWIPLAEAFIFFFRLREKDDFIQDLSPC